LTTIGTTYESHTPRGVWDLHVVPMVVVGIALRAWGSSISEPAGDCAHPVHLQLHHLMRTGQRPHPGKNPKQKHTTCGIYKYIYIYIKKYKYIYIYIYTHIRAYTHTHTNKQTDTQTGGRETDGQTDKQTRFSFQQILKHNIDYWPPPPRNLLWKDGLAWFGLTWLRLACLVWLRLAWLGLGFDLAWFGFVWLGLGVGVRQSCEVFVPSPGPELVRCEHEHKVGL
jgi:hypothetical protein